MDDKENSGDKENPLQMPENEEIENDVNNGDFEDSEEGNENGENRGRKRKLTADEEDKIKKRQKEEEEDAEEEAAEKEWEEQKRREKEERAAEKELDKKMKNLVKESYQKSCSKTEAFFNAFHLFKNLEKPTEEEVTKWFEQFENSSAKLEINEDLLKLTEMIDDDYMHFKHFVSDTDFPWYPFKNKQLFVPGFGLDPEKRIKGIIPYSLLKNETLPRYAFYLFPNYDEPKQMEFKVIDMFHSEQRRFQFVGEEFSWCVTGMSGNLHLDEALNQNRTVHVSLACQCYPIDPQHILILSTPKSKASYEESKQQLVYLLHLDYQKEECKIIDQKQVRYSDGATILIDPEDTGKFVVFNFRSDEYSLNYLEDEEFDDFDDEEEEDDSFNKITYSYAQFYNASTKELTFNTKLIVGEYFTSCPRFQNGKLDGFCLELDRSRGRSMFKARISGLSYWTFEQHQFSKHFEFKDLGNFNVKKNFTSNTSYAWFKDECFVLNPSSKYSREGFANLYSLNVATQRCTLIFTNFISYNFYFNLDGNLIAKKDQKLFYYTVKKPQKLENIVWREVNRQKRFFENENMYKQAMKQLPQTSQFQPFHF